MNAHTLSFATWTIGIYQGINKCASLFNVTLAEAVPLLNRQLEAGQHWSLYCIHDSQYYEFHEIIPFIKLLNPTSMQNSNMPALQMELSTLQRNLAAARMRYDRKKKEVSKSVMQDSPNLFGERASQTPDKLFYTPVDTTAIPEALAPLQLDISAIEREINRVSMQLMNAAQSPEPRLF